MFEREDSLVELWQTTKRPYTMMNISKEIRNMLVQFSYNSLEALYVLFGKYHPTVHVPPSPTDINLNLNLWRNSKTH